MIDTKVATGTKVYSKAARLARMALYLRMMFISFLKEKRRLSNARKYWWNEQNIYYALKSN